MILRKFEFRYLEGSDSMTQNKALCSLKYTELDNLNLVMIHK